jgi:hypothetical protein
VAFPLAKRGFRSSAQREVDGGVGEVVCRGDPSLQDTVALCGVGYYDLATILGCPDDTAGGC